MSFPFELLAKNDLPRISMLLDGVWVPGLGPDREVFDKYRMHPFAMLGTSSPEQITRMIGAAQEAFETDRLAPHDRGLILDRVAAALEARREDFLAVMQIETGYTTADC